MAAPAHGEVEAVDSGAGADDRVPVGGDVVGPGEAALELKAGEARIPRPQAAADGVLVAAREAVVTVVRALERILTGVGDGAELPPPVGADDDVRHRIRADRGGKRATGIRAPHQHLEPAKLDRLLGPKRPQQVVRPRPRGQDDLAGRDEAVRGLETDGATRLHSDRSHRPAEVVSEASARRGCEPAQAHLLRVRETTVRLVRSPSDSCQRQLGLDVRDLVGLDEPGVEAYGLQHRDVAPAGAGQRIRHGEQVAATHVARIGNAHLVLPAHDRPRAGHREPGGDRVGVVAAHHRERAAGVSVARHAPVEQRDAAGPVAAQGVGGRQPEDACADDGGVHRGAHGVNRIIAAFFHTIL